jgi:hypothetical protein
VEKTSTPVAQSVANLLILMLGSSLLCKAAKFMPPIFTDYVAVAADKCVLD